MTKLGIITPVKNEAENLPSLIESVVNQSFEPTAWVIVNDCSTDGSSKIIDGVVSEYTWVYSITRTSNMDYDVGFNYARVISQGFEFLHSRYNNELDYYMILDGDMQITKRYIEQLVQYIESNPNVSIVSGGMYIRKENGLEFVKKFKDRPIGGATIYDANFYNEIGGPPIAPSVDSVTRAKAKTAGKESRYLPEIDAKAVQSRPTGGKGNRFKRAVSRGVDNYYLSYNPLVVIAAGTKQFTRPPHYHAIGYIYGYFSQYILQKPQIDDTEVRRYFYQMVPREIFRNILPFRR